MVLAWRPPSGVVAALLGAIFWGLSLAPAWGCFGTRLRVGVLPGDAAGLAAYALGYFVAEKTGIEPEFVPWPKDPAQAFADHGVDVLVTSASVAPPASVVVRDAGTVPGLGPARFWLHPEVLDDLRFFTVERALGRAGVLFAAPAYAAAARSGEAPRKAARQAVLHVQ